jgi:hypothetical protein
MEAPMQPPATITHPDQVRFDVESAYWVEVVDELIAALRAAKAESAALREIIAGTLRPSAAEPHAPGIATFTLTDRKVRLIVLRRPDGTIESIEV